MLRAAQVEVFEVLQVGLLPRVHVQDVAVPCLDVCLGGWMCVNRGEGGDDKRSDGVDGWGPKTMIQSSYNTHTRTQNTHRPSAPAPRRGGGRSSRPTPWRCTPRGRSRTPTAVPASPGGWSRRWFVVVFVPRFGWSGGMICGGWAGQVMEAHSRRHICVYLPNPIMLELSTHTLPPRTRACLWNMASAMLAAPAAMARTRTTYLVEVIGGEGC